MAAECARDRYRGTADCAQQFDHVGAGRFLADMLVYRFDHIEEIIEGFDEVPYGFWISVFADQPAIHRLAPGTIGVGNHKQYRFLQFWQRHRFVDVEITFEG